MPMGQTEDTVISVGFAVSDQSVKTLFNEINKVLKGVDGKNVELELSTNADEIAKTFENLNKLKLDLDKPLNIEIGSKQLNKLKAQLNTINALTNSKIKNQLSNSLNYTPNAKSLRKSYANINDGFSNDIKQRTKELQSYISAVIKDIERLESKPTTSIGQVDSLIEKYKDLRSILLDVKKASVGRDINLNYDKDKYSESNIKSMLSTLTNESSVKQLLVQNITSQISQLDSELKSKFGNLFTSMKTLMQGMFDGTLDSDTFVKEFEKINSYINSISSNAKEEVGEIDGFINKIKSLEEEIITLTSKLNSSVNKTEYDKQSIKIDNLKAELEELRQISQEYEKLKSKLSTSTDNESALKEQVSKLQASLQAKTAQLEQTLKASQVRQADGTTSSLSTTATAKEAEAMTQLKKIVDSVKQAINEKTTAFENEVSTVTRGVDVELEKIGKLVSAFNKVKEAIQSSSSMSNNVEKQRIEAEIQAINAKTNAISEENSIASIAINTEIDQFKKLLETINQVQTALKGMKGIYDAVNSVANADTKTRKRIKRSKQEPNYISSEDYDRQYQDWMNINKLLLLSDDNYSNVLDTKIERTKNGIVKMTAVVQDSENQWKHFSSTLDSSGNMINKVLQDLNEAQIARLNARFQPKYGNNSHSEPTASSNTLTTEEIKSQGLNSLNEYIEKIKQSSQYSQNAITEVQYLYSEFSQKIDTTNLNNYEKELNEVATKIKAILDQDLLRQGFQTKYSSINNIGIKSQIVELQNATGKTDSYIRKVQELEIIYEELNNTIATAKLSNPTEIERAEANFKELQQQIKNTIKELKSVEYNTSNAYGRYAGTLIPNTVIKSQEEANQYIKSILANQKVVSSNMPEPQFGRWKGQIEDVDGTIKDLSYTYSSTAEGIYQNTTRVTKATTAWGDFLEQTGKKWNEVFRYFMSFGSVYTVFNQLRNGIEVVKELNSAFIEMKKVCNESEQQLKAFANQSHSTAQSIGSTALNLQNSAADFMRLGYSLNDSAELAKNTAILMNVSEFENVSDATESLISMMQAYDVQAKDSMEIIDKLNNIGNNYSISSSDLAQSLQRSASALKVAGNSIDEAIALTVAGMKYCLIIQKCILRTYLIAGNA